MRKERNPQKKKTDIRKQREAQKKRLEKYEKKNNKYTFSWKKRIG